jgi:hypothetical protein
MKLIAIALILLFLGCKKDVVPTEENNSLQLTRSDDALLPLKCHTLSLSSLKLVKELYPDTRVKSLTLGTRNFLGLEWKWFLYFAYYPNQARIRGSRGEYLNGVRQSINRDTIEVNFNSYGYATTVYTISASRVRTLQLTLTYNTSNPALIRLTKMNNVPVINDVKGNIISIKPTPNYGVAYTYNLNSGAGKRHFYSPAIDPVVGNFILSDYFALLELMQWIPMPRNTRTSVETFPFVTGDDSRVVNLTNHQFDASGNLVRFIIDDGGIINDPYLVENIGWHCSP